MLYLFKHDLFKHELFKHELFKHELFKHVILVYTCHTLMFVIILATNKYNQYALQAIYSLTIKLQYFYKYLILLHFSFLKILDNKVWINYNEKHTI